MKFVTFALFAGLIAGLVFISAKIDSLTKDLAVMEESRNYYKALHEETKTLLFECSEWTPINAKG